MAPKLCLREITDCPVFFAVNGWLCFIMEGATTPCNWSRSLCLFICFALASVHKSQAGKPAEPAPAGEASAGEQGPTVSPRGLWFPETDTTHKSLCPLSLLPRWCWGWDRRLAYQIFICLLCRVPIIPTGEMLCWDQSGSCARLESLAL